MTNSIKFFSAKEKKDGRLGDGVAFLSSFLEKIVRSKGLRKSTLSNSVLFFFKTLVA
jgi:hypothetical protein